ncbi:tetratricopeptide repeat protein, partial [Actinomadura roseirufa]|uniref:tetratricopeptide repeat protein n=1 Tax=Actinomadura roseirufa TaxID=2094049 RepID=UPI0010418D54
MARRPMGGDPGREEDLPTIIAEIDRSAGDPARTVLWCRRALRHPLVRASPRGLAAVQVRYGRGLRDLADGDRRENVELALEALLEAVSGYERLDDDAQLAATLHTLGTVYADRIAGDGAQNIERSMACHSRALRLATVPTTRAMAAYELARRYRARAGDDPAGDTEAAIANLRIAVEGYRAAGETSCRADAVSLLGLCYEERRTGSRRDNLEEAIACHKAAVDGYVEGSGEWLQTIYKLGMAYSRRIAGDEAGNNELALDCFKRMHRVADPRTFPEAWSNANHALGVAYNSRRRGDRAENIELAIEHLTEALRHIDPLRDRQNWQITHHSLAASYDYRLAGDRGANLDRAVEHLTTALGGDRSDDPRRRAMFQQSLSMIYLKRAQDGSPNGHRKDDLRRAREALDDVLTVRTREADPAGWARAMQLMTVLQNEDATLPETEPAADRAPQDERAPKDERGAKGDEAGIRRLERNIATLRSSAEVYDRDADPEGWARNRLMLEMALSEHAAVTDPDRYWAERAVLLQQALQVHTLESNPGLCSGSALRLGNAFAAVGRWADASDAFVLAVEAAESQYPAALTVLGRRHHLESGPSTARLASYC